MENRVLKENIIIETDSIKLSSLLHDYGFKNTDINFYEDKFSDLKELSVIQEGEFSNNSWTIIDLNTKVHYTFEFPLNRNRELTLALKSYVVLQVMEGFSVAHCQSILNRILRTISMSNNFDSEGYTAFELRFDQLSPRQKEDYSISCLGFYDFYASLFDRRYYSFLKTIPIADRKARELPDYQSVIAFDEIIKSFMDASSLEEKKRFYPLYLWWRITTVIPTRPEEFLLIKSNSVFERNNSYWIKIPRKKKERSHINQLEIEDTLKITKEIFDIIVEYKEMLTEEERSEYLFSYMGYFNFIKESHKQQSLGRRNRTDKMDKGQMYELLDDFYKEIVEERYKELDVSRVKLGDTRHFAFCNMMLQGFNMLTIARIGGHQSLKSQVHYSHHLDYFAEAKVRVLSDQIKRNRKRDIGMSFTDEINSLIVRSKMNNRNGLRVKNGYCHDVEFPNNCMSECLYCPSFTVDINNNPNVLKDLLSKSKQISQNISDQIETMQKLSREMFYDIKTVQYSHEEQERLFNLSKKLEQLINHKTMINSYIEEGGETNGK